VTGARSERTPERRATVAEAVAELAQRALQAAKPEDLLREALMIAVTVMGADYGTALRQLPDGGMQVAGEMGPYPIATGTVLPIAPARSYSLEVVTSGRPFLSGDLRTDPRIAPPGPLLARGVLSGLAVPIMGSRGVLGVLALHSGQLDRFSSDDVADAGALADVVRVAWEQAEHLELLSHQAMHDPLTGLPNRTLFFDRLYRALDRRPPGPRRPHTARVAVMLVDLDDFKLVNDRFGHAAGDTLLVHAGQRLSEAVRPEDTVARLGGDEFAILCEQLPDRQTALDLARRVQTAGGQRLDVPDADIAVSASVGLALGYPGQPGPAEDLLREADAALYHAKKHGRGGLHVFDIDLLAADVLPVVHDLVSTDRRHHGPARAELPPEPRSARRARRFVIACCHEWDLDPLAETAGLLTTELVANALVHSRSEVTLTVRHDLQGLLVEVGDLDSRPPQLAPPSPDALGGRGLILVDALAEAWGTTATPTGKTVWFRLP
jgi:diguanylate cyclase (GGDEF)-like protein